MQSKIEIKVSAHLNKEWQYWFGGMDLIHEGKNTIIRGKVKDQMSIYRILNLIRDLNLKLISVNHADEELISK